jgi:hypothetical protein
MNFLPSTFDCTYKTSLKTYLPEFFSYGKFEDTRGIIRSRKCKDNGQLKTDNRTSNHLQNTTQKHWAIRIRVVRMRNHNNTKVSIMEQEMLILPEYLSSPLVSTRIRIAQCFCVVFCRWLLVLLSVFNWPLSLHLRLLIIPMKKKKNSS